VTSRILRRRPPADAPSSDASTPRLVVHHFGPDPATIGGMASVIRVHTENGLGSDLAYSHPTWRSDSLLSTTWLATGSAVALLRMPATEIAHVHLSERGSFLREGSLVALAHSRGIVTVATIHGASFMRFATGHRRLVSAVLRRADLIICLDRTTLDFVRGNAPGVRSELLPNPVLVDDDFSPADETAELVVFAGEIGLRKGADVLARAWPRVARSRPNARCLMVGPVADFEPTKMERLEVRAPVSAIEMKRVLREARVIALPTRAEAMPMVLAEAMSLGRPFVSTPVGGIPELAGAGGILVPVDDDVALANRLTELLSDPDLARSIGERGRRFCQQTLSVEVIGARLRELYSAAAAARAERTPPR
jgi:glycosyltransferase involved in cell wall biosynthesis